MEQDWNVRFVGTVCGPDPTVAPLTRSGLAAVESWSGGPGEGEGRGRFLTAFATVPVPRSPPCPRCLSPLSNPACAIPVRGARSRSCLGPRVREGECVMHEAAQNRVGRGPSRIERGARSSAAGGGHCRWRGSCSPPHRPAVPAEIVGVLHRSLLPALAFNFGHSDDYWQIQHDAAPSANPSGFGTGRSRYGIAAPWPGCRETGRC